MMYLRVSMDPAYIWVSLFMVSRVSSRDIPWATLFVVLVLYLMMSFFTTALKKRSLDRAQQKGSLLICCYFRKNCQEIIYVLDLEVSNLFIDSGCESRTYVNAILLKYVCIFISAKFVNQSFGFELKMQLWCVYLCPFAKLGKLDQKMVKV